jgi:TatD DNase family protein
MAPWIASELMKAQLSSVNVQLQSHDPEQYRALVGPHNDLGLEDACVFTQALVQEGIPVTVSAVARDGVNMEAVQELSEALGAGFRARPYFP